MKEKVLNTIKKYNLIQPDDGIVIGVSGRARFNLFITCAKRIKKRIKL